MTVLSVDYGDPESPSGRAGSGRGVGKLPSGTRLAPQLDQFSESLSSCHI